MLYLIGFVVVGLLLVFDVFYASAAYEPLIGEGFFSGVTSDVMAGAGGWLAVAVAVAGAMLILRVLTR